MAGTPTIEVERTFDVAAAFALPDLAGLTGVASAGPPEERQLHAVYFDSPDLRLSRAGVTLRRRTGGPDAGWHVKLPLAEGARQELRHPLGRAVTSPPRAVWQPLAGVLRGAPVGPVAELRTRRTAVPLLDREGRVLAEVADDRVTATAMAPDQGSPAVVTSWREVEVELVEGDPALLDQVSAALRRAGAQPSTAGSKLRRALASRLDGTRADGRPRGAAQKPDPRGKRAAEPPAGEVLLAALRAQVAALQRADVMVRTDADGGVRRMRIACRRLRGILAAYRPVLARERTDPVRNELRWLGGELSAARDAEMSLAHLRALVASQPPELVLGPVAARLQQADLGAAASGRRRALRVLAGDRYFALVDSLADLLADPPLTDAATAPAEAIAERALGRAAERLRRKVAAATATDDPQARELRLHDVRRAARRLRYTAEVAQASAGGTRAAGALRIGKRVQKALGERQDAVVTRGQCRSLGLSAAAAGENAYTYGRLDALEEVRAARAEQRFADRWPAADRDLQRLARRR